MKNIKKIKTNCKRRNNRLVLIKSVSTYLNFSDFWQTKTTNKNNNNKNVV